MASLGLTLITACSFGVLLHWWPRLAPTQRRRLGIVANLGGIAFLVAALRAEGSRESAMTSAVFLGTASRTAIESAQASYSYYVLTATCLLLGFAALGFGDALAAWLSARPLFTSVTVAWLVTLVRFLLEKSAAPRLVSESVGVTWMIPIAGAYLALALPDEVGWRRRLARRLVAYAFLVRGFVAATSLLATRLELGTHYDVSALTSVALAFTGRVYAFAPAGWPQLLWLVVLPQLVAWPTLTVLVGLVGGVAARRLLPPARRRERAGPPTPATTPEGD